MNAVPMTIDDVFDRRLTFPDLSAQQRFARLVGIEDAKLRLTKLMAALVNPDGVTGWANKFHKGAPTLVNFLERRPPLVILSGDVGTGKTELAETVGDTVARQEDTEVTLYPLSLASRGSGRVGEMTNLLSFAFEQTVQAARKLRNRNGKSTGALILLVDEADALTQNREETQMHHEDRAGVNSFIRGVDRLSEQRLPAAVILCTNRLGAIDPAVKRRAAEIFEFSRPNDVQRLAVLETPLKEAGLVRDEIREIVALTGAKNSTAYGFTFSDLTQRLLPALVLDAYPNQAITFERAQHVITAMNPTPPFNGDFIGHSR
jgi:AAA+ superfamily predicted ATPase